MLENLKKIGNILRERRENQNKTISEISKLTKIKEKYIEAIENGDSTVFPAEVYLIGYIKAYARVVGLTDDELKLAKEDFETKGEKASKEQEEEKPLPRKLAVVPISFGGIVMIAAFVVVLVGIILFIKGKNIQPPEESGLFKVESLVDTTISKFLKYSGEDISQVVLCRVGSINPGWAISRVDSVTLELESKETTTLLVETDYKRAFKGTVSPGVRKMWRAKDAFYLTIGRPGAVSLWFNGFPIKRFAPLPAPLEIYINRGNVLSLIETDEKKPQEEKPIIKKRPDTSKSTTKELQDNKEEKPSNGDSVPSSNKINEIIE